MLAYVLSLLDRTILTLMIEPLQADLAISDTEFGLLTGMAFVAFYTIAGVPIGWLVDRTSRRGIVAAGVGLWSLMCMLSGFAANYLHLFLARVGLGVGEASLNPAAYSLISDLFPKDKLARALGVFSTGGMLGVGLAFLFGGKLVEALSDAPDLELPILGSLRVWQLGFLIAGAPGLLLALLMLTAAEWRRPAPVAAAAPPSSSWSDFFAFLRTRGRPLFLIIAAFCFLTLINYAFLSWMPALLLRRHGIGAGDVGMIMGLASGVFGLAGFVAGGSLADRWVRQGRSDAHLRVGFVGTLAALPLAIGATLSGPTMLAGAFLCALMFMLTLPSAAAMAGLQLLTPPLFRGRMTAVFMAIVNFVALGFGPLAVALFTDYLFAEQAQVHLSLLLVSAIFLPLAVLAFGLGRRPLAIALESGATHG